MLAIIQHLKQGKYWDDICVLYLQLSGLHCTFAAVKVKLR